ncbi:CRP-like cAMP-activated global transcriptional regulator [Pandoraea iniqua]|uniref:CRP-like cAMP-activated global transcriptional regulator n=1 Tax=Pandoraea iniqua TaxID=2508288 RepID=A0A5E4W5Q5_9BURK|nr:Crp/Fnr family transcriptional regulator [Pandoraea iniqua]VVE18415.1 CRP-like cAMP-activated global transcriptional regulator [Pandoraea iniqua]VVE25906.1 CRP-like cAMP-activated global transcriptional regulator [Pandoraea iniqua]
MPTKKLALPTTQTWHLDDATADIWTQAAHLGHRKKYVKGAVIYRQGEQGFTFYFLLAGRVQVSIFQHDGAEFILEVMGPGSMFGESPAVEGDSRIATAITVEDAELIEFDIRAIIDAIPARPELAVSLMRIIALKQRVLASRIQYLALPKPEMRIGELLARLADLYGEVHDGRTLISIALTHEQIAAMTGATRVTVTRALKRLTDLGVIELKQRRIWVIDRTRLLG